MGLVCFSYTGATQSSTEKFRHASELGSHDEVCFLGVQQLYTSGLRHRSSFKHNRPREISSFPA